MKSPKNILLELAGASSLCWNPRPIGVFDSGQAIKFTDDALTQLEKHYLSRLPEEKKCENPQKCLYGTTEDGCQACAFNSCLALVRSIYD